MATSPNLSTDLLAQVLDLLPLAVYVLDPNGTPYYANKASIELLGKGIDPSVKPENTAMAYQAYIAGTNELYPPNEVPVVAALAGKESHIVNMEIRRPDRTVLIEVWGKPIKDEQGKLMFAVAIFRDITELSKANESLNIRNKELEKMSSFMIEREKIINELRRENALLKSRPPSWEAIIKLWILPFSDQMISEV